MKLAIFDMDGTLIDSEAIILSAMRAGFEAEGMAPPDDAAIRSIVGLSLPQAVARLAPSLAPAKVAELAERYKQSFIRLREEAGGEADAPLFPGARAALERLEAAGWAMAVATGKARRGVEHTLDAHDLRRFFIATQSADDAPSKPHPGMIENILSATGAAAADAWMIGDTTFDMDMAAHAGLRAVGVSWGYHPAAALRASGAAAVIDHFDALDAALGLS